MIFLACFVSLYWQSQLVYNVSAIEALTALS
jgi:hypothetical protein